MASATHRPKQVDTKPAWLDARFNLEGAVNDAAVVCSIANTLLEDALRPSSLTPPLDGFKTFHLTESQWNNLAWIIGEAQFKSQQAVEAFDAVIEAQRAN